MQWTDWCLGKHDTEETRRLIIKFKSVLFITILSFRYNEWERVWMWQYF